METFSAQFYMRLIDEYSVIEAFEWAKEKATNGEVKDFPDRESPKVSDNLEVGTDPTQLSVEKMLNMSIAFEDRESSKVSDSLEVGIVPILLDMDNKIHKRKLFDSKA